MTQNVALISVLLLLTIGGKTTARSCVSLKQDWQSRIGILISPLISRSTINEIEIYWNNVDFQTGDTIALYTEKPTGNALPIYTLVPDGPNGVRKTGIQADLILSENLNFTRQCLKYHVAWLRDGVVTRTNCLQTQPTWMQERKDFLGPLKMSKVFLPGTHNSASYALHERPSVENIIQRHAVTQDVDILSQLIFGVRYLDIRIGHYPFTKEVWWTNHGIYRSVSLKTVIDQVKTFLDNTDEIVIFDIQEFPIGFGKNLTVHEQLVAYLQRQFDGYLLKQNTGWVSSLDSIWSSGKRLIIGYDDARVVARYDSVWPCVIHQWGNVRNIKDLYNHLNEIETVHGPHRLTPRSAMAELTPNAFDIILNRLGSLRQMAHGVNLNVTNWYSTVWQYSANIVAVDFVRDTGIVETAIESNDKRRHLTCRF